MDVDFGGSFVLLCKNTNHVNLGGKECGYFHLDTRE